MLIHLGQHWRLYPILGILNKLEPVGDLTLGILQAWELDLYLDIGSSVIQTVIPDTRILKVCYNQHVRLQCMYGILALLSMTCGQQTSSTDTADTTKNITAGHRTHQFYLRWII